jgi:hypothetical protein
MLLFVIIFIIFIINIQFLIKNIFFGVDSVNFFMFTNTYPFSKDIAEGTLLFVILCTVGFCVGYYLAKISVFKNKKNLSVPRAISEINLPLTVKLFTFFILVQIIIGIYVLFISNMNYAAINEAKRSMNFLFELRMLPMLLLSYVCMNVHPKEWMQRKVLRPIRFLLPIYLMLTVMLQARSVTFELVSVLIICWLLWYGNKVRIKYIVVLCLALLAPNLLVLFRFVGADLLNINYVLDNLFSLEYSIIFVNIVSAAMVYNSGPLWGASFIPNLFLIVPSPVREFLGWGSKYTEVNSIIAQDAGVYGGGFSLFAEMYINFNWWSILGFILLGLFIGKIIKTAMKKIGRSSIINAAAPLIYISFLLLLRNDLGVFIKYVVQVFLICLILAPIIKNRFFLKGL